MKFGKGKITMSDNTKKVLKVVRDILVFLSDFIDKIIIGILLMPFACMCTFLSDTMFGSSKKRRRR